MSEIREAIGPDLYDGIESRVIDHAVEVLLLGGSLHETRDGFVVHYPSSVARKIAAAAVTKAADLTHIQQAR